LSWAIVDEGIRATPRSSIREIETKIPQQWFVVFGHRFPVYYSESEWLSFLIFENFWLLFWLNRCFLLKQIGLITSWVIVKDNTTLCFYWWSVLTNDYFYSAIFCTESRSKTSSKQSMKIVHSQVKRKFKQNNHE
jgi:hypothetical protein